jgi:hypothetical protein
MKKTKTSKTRRSKECSNKIPIESMDEAFARLTANAPINRKQERDEASSSERTCPKILSGDFGDRIELLYGPQVIHKSNIFPRGHLSIGIVGASGCGKSYLLLSIIPQIDNLTQVIVCSRVHTPVYDQLKHWCENTKIICKKKKSDEEEADEDDHISFALYSEPAEADEGIREMTLNKPQNSYGIIIFDDFNEGTTAHNNQYMKIQNVCTMQKRNDGYHSCIVTQQYTNIGTKSRNNTNMLFAFTMHDKYAIDGFARHVFEATGIDANDVRECFREVTKEKHSYMLLTQDGGTGKLYAKRNGPDGPNALEEVEFVNTRSSIDEIINDSHLLSLIETELRISKKPKSSMVHREITRIRTNIKQYITILAKENDIEYNDIIHELFTRGIIDL